jgi:hypothetical protein
VSLFGYRERRRIAELEAREQVRLRHIEDIEEQLQQAGITPGNPSRAASLERQVIAQQAALLRLTRAVRGLLDDVQAGGGAR